MQGSATGSWADSASALGITIIVIIVIVDPIPVRGRYNMRYCCQGQSIDVNQGRLLHG